jgi:hypothetical protein
MKRFKDFYNNLDKEGQTMLNTFVEFITLVGLFVVSFLLITYFIIL